MKKLSQFQKRLFYILLSIIVFVSLAIGLYALTKKTETDKNITCKYNTNPDGLIDGELKVAIEDCQDESECDYINYPSYSTLEEAQDECHAYFGRLNDSKASCDKIHSESMKAKCYQILND